jgi:integrase
MDTHLFDEFILDWHIAGKAQRTAHEYVRYLREFASHNDEPTLLAVKTWVASTPSTSVRRKRAQAVRAFGTWCETNSYETFTWWRQIPLAQDVAKPQATATEHDYRRAMRILTSDRDKLVVELLWTTGLRRSELTSLQVRDVNLGSSCLVVRQSKNGTPRVVPLSPQARRLIRRVSDDQNDCALLGMSSNAVRLMLQRTSLPSAHAWRRGWAVNSLKHGVSESTIRTVAGWSTSQMVSHYVRTHRTELAVREYHRLWEPKGF